MSAYRWQKGNANFAAKNPVTNRFKFERNSSDTKLNEGHSIYHNQNKYGAPPLKFKSNHTQCLHQKFTKLSVHNNNRWIRPRDPCDITSENSYKCNNLTYKDSYDKVSELKTNRIIASNSGVCARSPNKIKQTIPKVHSFSNLPSSMIDSYVTSFLPSAKEDFKPKSHDFVAKKYYAKSNPNIKHNQTQYNLLNNNSLSNPFQMAAKPLNTKTKWVNIGMQNKTPKSSKSLIACKPKAPSSIKYLSKTKLVRSYSNSQTPKKPPVFRVNTRNKLIRVGHVSGKFCSIKSSYKRRNSVGSRLLKHHVGSKKNNSFQSKSLRYVNIGGKVFKTNGMTLKRQSLDLHKKVEAPVQRPNITSVQKIKRLQPGQLTEIVRRRQRTTFIKKQDEILCITFGMTGKCPLLKKKICPCIHDVSKIAICTRFLQGSCNLPKCPFSHTYCKKKMPTCVHYLEGFCSKEDCKYRHVKVDQNAPLCFNFLRGQCLDDEECQKKHILVCQEFQNSGSCRYGKACPLYHKKIKPKIKRPQKPSLPFLVNRQWGTFGEKLKSKRKKLDELDFRYFDPTQKSKKLDKPDDLEAVRMRLLKKVGSSQPDKNGIVGQNISLESVFIHQTPLPQVLSDFYPV